MPVTLTAPIDDVILNTNETVRVGRLIAEYQPLSAEHARFHASLKPYRWLFGGNQAGKSYTNMIDLAMIALNVHPYRTIESKNTIHWACIESWEQVRDVLWEPQLKLFIPPNRIVGIRYGSEQAPRKIYLDNGHRIEFKAFNQSRTLFQGRSIHSCHCDEQCLSDFRGIFTEIQARLLKYDGFLTWSLTPITPQPELEERIDGLPDTDDLFFIGLNSNRRSQGGYLPDESIDRMIADWPAEMQPTRVEGRFATYLGAVFKTFRRHQHVITPFRIPTDWPRYRSVDFGFTNPFVCLWMAKDKDSNWYVYQEYYVAQKTIGEHIPLVKSLSRNERYAATWADPESAGDRAEMAKAGLPTRVARKEVARGIEAVQSCLKMKRNGKPSLFVFNTCRHTIRELTTYRYATATTNRNAADLPVAKDDHTVDALRYCIFSTDRPQKKGSVYAA